MSLFANRWRALREAASTEVASSAVEPSEPPERQPVRRAGKLKTRPEPDAWQT